MTPPSSRFTSLIDAIVSIRLSPDELSLLGEAIDSPEYRDGVTPSALNPPHHQPPQVSGHVGSGHVVSGHVVLVSGGADSTTCYRLATLTGLPVTAVYINMGQPYATAELQVVSTLGINPVVIHTPPIYSENSPYKHILPARNLICLDIAAKMGNPGECIWFGVVNGETPPTGGDKSESFLRMVGEYLGQQYGLGLKTLQNRTKAEWARWWLITQDDPGLLLKTVTCYAYDGDKHCGQCQGCLRRWCAMVLAGYDENQLLATYHRPPLTHAKQAVEKYTTLMLDELNGRLSHYGARRCMQMLTVLIPEKLPIEWRWVW